MTRILFDRYADQAGNGDGRISAGEIRRALGEFAAVYGQIADRYAGNGDTKVTEDEAKRMDAEMKNYPSIEILNMMKKYGL